MGAVAPAADGGGSQFGHLSAQSADGFDEVGVALRRATHTNPTANCSAPDDTSTVIDATRTVVV